MDLNLYLGFPSLGQQDHYGVSSDPGNAERLPQNAEATFPIPVQSRQHWSSRNRRQRRETSNDTTVNILPESTGLQPVGSDYEVAELVHMYPMYAHGETGNSANPFKRPSKCLDYEKDNGQAEREQKPGANFECNVCFEFAKEPVVTSCGHLFCWPCLYQWLYVHSDTKECPVCKGLVTDSNIIPIYGRGDANSGNTCGGESSSCLKPPPRPHGLRLESLRQRMLMSRAPEYGSFPLDEILNGIHSQGISQTRRRVRTLRRNSLQGWHNPYPPTRLPARHSRVRATTTHRGDAHPLERDLDSGSWDDSFSNVLQRITQNHLEGHERLSSLGASLASMENIIARLANETDSGGTLSVDLPSNLQQPENHHSS